MSGDGVVCSGWLRKSPPEKKLRRCAWKTRWFILRSGDPGVLEYYKNNHSKKPLRVINLGFCEQVDAGLTFNRKELRDSYVFDVKTSERTFYLVAETKEDMNKWVRNICQISGFIQSKDRSDSLRNIPLVSHGPHSSPTELSGSNQRSLRERRTSAPSHSSQSTLFTSESPPNHIRTTLPTSAARDSLFLHQQSENTRIASFSQATRFFMRSNPPVQKLSQENGHYINRVGGRVHAFYGVPKPSWHNSELRGSAYDLPRSFGCYAHTKLSRTSSETSEIEEVYTFKTPNSTRCKDFGELSTDSCDIPGAPLSIHQTPRACMLYKNHNALTVASGDTAATPPPRPPKLGQAESCWGSPQQRLMDGRGLSVSPVATTTPRRNMLPAVGNCRLLRASSRETHKHPQPSSGGTVPSAESAVVGPSSYLQNKTLVARSRSVDSEDDYVPMNPVPSLLQNTERPNDSSQHLYGPMSPGPHQLDLMGCSSSAFPAQKGSSSSQPLRRMGEIQPPQVNRNLKPDQKGKPATLDLRGNSVIRELPFKSPVTNLWSRPGQTFHSNFSQYCRPTCAQSITSTNSGGSAEDYVPMQNLLSASPVPGGKSSPAPEKSTASGNYLVLDFELSSPGPHQKPPTSSVASDEKVDYKQVDKEKTQALQRTMQEWVNVRQSSEPSKMVKQ
ncbi:GRB2-associated-binding protein 2-like [Candoia aspera]|uniref:GRB2-associated-binding protein 2-like n=1 Tax=Candoia aspera TaxID=51853 RepID=UPI002FD7A05D